MCKVCDGFPVKIDEMTPNQIKQAFIDIGIALEQEKDQKKIDHLLKISDKILDKEVPFKEVDEELEKLYQDENG